ncbi:hypothetical protein OG864_01175 [Streptomyces sp. NBC_00124]|nr:hypothetical protein [Streptomyces sp. NBC_00140]MCX5357385.1 hypothetical protein [Streptomyces sp. NBC_00124]
MGLDIDQHCPVSASTSGGEIIHAQHPWRRRARVGQRHQHIQQGDPADDDVEHGGKPGSGPVGDGQRNGLDHDPQHNGAASVADGQALDLLGEGAPCATGDIAEQPPNRQVDDHRSAAHRNIGQASQIPTVDPARENAAVRTRQGVVASAAVHPYHAVQH